MEKGTRPLGQQVGREHLLEGTAGRPSRQRARRLPLMESSSPRKTMKHPQEKPGRDPSPAVAQKRP